MKAALFLTLLSFSTFAVSEKIDIYVDGNEIQTPSEITLTYSDKMILEDVGVGYLVAIYADGEPVPVDGIYADGDMTPDLVGRIQQKCEDYGLENSSEICQVNSLILSALELSGNTDIYIDGQKAGWCLKCDEGGYQI